MQSVEHLVFSGGGHNGFTLYGAARESSKMGMWSLSSLKSVYGTSAGAIVGVMIALGYDWEWLDDYLVKRPWDKLLDPTEHILDAYTEGGIYGIDVFQGILGPLLEVKGMSINITLSEFAKKTGVRVHCMATDLNQGILKPLVLGPETTPTLSVVEAVAASAAYPILFRPVYTDGKCLIDGAVVCLYPDKECITQEKARERTLGFRIKWSRAVEILMQGSNLFDVAGILFWKSVRTICDWDRNNSDIKEIVSSGTRMNYETLKCVLTSEEERLALINLGARNAREQFESLITKTSPQTDEAPED
jgi:predicted acylesterase/phospholipase RssA